MKVINEFGVYQAPDGFLKPSQCKTVKDCLHQLEALKKAINGKILISKKMHLIEHEVYLKRRFNKLKAIENKS